MVSMTSAKSAGFDAFMHSLEGDGRVSLTGTQRSLVKVAYDAGFICGAEHMNKEWSTNLKRPWLYWLRFR